MFYPLASILSPLWLERLVNIAHLNALHECVSNPSNTEFRLSIAHGNKMDMASSTFLISKYLFYA